MILSKSSREPAFNAPGVVIAMLAVFAGVHAVRYLLSDQADVETLLRFAFIPARYDSASPYAGQFPGGVWADAWTFVTYALLHGGLTHLLVNSVWLLAFGSALAWRFGTGRFLLFSVVTAAAGAATHLALHFGSPGPVVGASAAISGHMAAAMRFMFEAGGPLGAFRQNGRKAFLVPAESLTASLRRPQVLVFLAVWFGANALFGLGGELIEQDGALIAWEAHIGGFVAGLLLFPLLDPVPSGSSSLEAHQDGLPRSADSRHDGDPEPRAADATPPPLGYAAKDGDGR